MQDKKDTTNSNYAESFPAPVAHSLKRIHQGTGGAAGKAGARNATPNKAQQRESGTQLRTRHSRRKAERNSEQGTAGGFFACCLFLYFGSVALFAPLARPAATPCLSPLGFEPPVVPRSPSCSAFRLLCLVLRPVPLSLCCASFSVLFRAPAFPAAPPVPWCVLRRRNRCGEALGSVHIYTNRNNSNTF